VERLTVLARASAAEPVVGRSPASFGLSTKQIGHLHRFIDVTKFACRRLAFTLGAWDHPIDKKLSMSCP
jgi:hypothetical protein